MGLERIGGVPAPDGDPEVVRFVPAEASPDGAPMLVVANEVSGTVTLWRIRSVQ